MRYLLDTNILSDLIKPRPSAMLVAWMGEQVDEDLFIASLTVAEIRRGILEKPAGRKRDQLDAWFSGPEGPAALSTLSSLRLPRPTTASSSPTTKRTLPTSRPSILSGMRSDGRAIKV